MVVMRHLRHYTLRKGGPAWQGASGCLPTGRGLCRRAAGFSMVELLITLVLIGIVAAIAVPSFRGWVDNSNLKAAARTLSSDIAYMRAAAMSNGRTHMVVYDMAQNRYTLRWDSDGAGTYADVANYPASRLMCESRQQHPDHERHPDADHDHIERGHQSIRHRGDNQQSRLHGPRFRR